jgi:hypothetical protein
MLAALMALRDRDREQIHIRSEAFQALNFEIQLV